MKRLALAAAMFMMVVTGAFAQADLQPLAIVKLNKSETITLKQLKTRVETYRKQQGISSFTIEQKKEILEAMIDEKLVVQAAQKAGLNITDTQVNQYFLQNLSQQVGRPVTEAEFADLIKKSTNLSLDDFMRDQVGMNVAEFKAYLKNELIAQQYVMQAKQDVIAKIAPADGDIRSFYEMNKASFVQSDMLKLFLVIVPKAADAAAAKAKANALYADAKNKKTSIDSLKANLAKDSSYQGGDIFVSKTAVNAQQLGISFNELIDLFNRELGFFSELNETENDYQFYTIRAKYPQKMLALSDLIQPETTITVYDYIKQNLTQQLQSEALIRAVQDITGELNTPTNVDRKKTGTALEKLLDW